jgi:uncharacterized membrane protein YdbT with pleckstrin-like domain
MSDTTPTESEQILWKGSVSHWHYAGRWLLFLLLVGGAVAIFFFPLPASLPPLVVQAVLAGLALVILVAIYIDRARRSYIITDHRISVEHGILSKQSSEIRLHDVRSINLTLTGLKGLFGIGRVEFSSAAGEDDDVVFWNVGGAEAIRDKVRGLQRREDLDARE